MTVNPQDTLRRCHKSAAAMTLLEVMVAMVVLCIVALGALGYQYYAVAQGRVAHAQITATRTGQLLLEDWKSTGGSEDYDPTKLGLGFVSTTDKVSEFGYGEKMGTAVHGTVYAITVDDVEMQIVLKWKDVDHDPIAEMTLRQLGVVVRFEEGIEERYHYNEKGEWVELPSGSLAAYNPAIILTTYARLDASGG